MQNEHSGTYFQSTFQIREYSIWATLILCSPDEDFGRIDKRGNPDFRSTFQGREYSFWATNHWKGLLNSGVPLLSILPKSSFGREQFEKRFENTFPDVWTTFQNLRLGSMDSVYWISDCLFAIRWIGRWYRRVARYTDERPAWVRNTISETFPHGRQPGQYVGSL